MVVGIFASFKSLFAKRGIAWWSFLREYYRNQRAIGSIAPSSRFLARAICKDLPRDSTPLQVLEVGPGSGAITGHLYRSLRQGDHLTVVELNPHFVACTKRLLARLKAERVDAPDYEVVESNILDYASVGLRFDVIICSLPFNNFDADLIRQLFSHLLSLGRQGGELRFYEYLLLRRLRIWLSFGRLAGLANMKRALAEVVARFGVSRVTVWLNLPPAIVHVLRVP